MNNIPKCKKCDSELIWEIDKYICPKCDKNNEDKQKELTHRITEFQNRFGHIIEQDKEDEEPQASLF